MKTMLLVVEPGDAVEQVGGVVIPILVRSLLCARDPHKRPAWVRDKEAWTASSAKSVLEIRDKLQLMVAMLSGWGSTTFGSVRMELRKLRSRLGELREDPYRTSPSREEIKVEDRIVELRFREEVMWRQRARIQWLLEGDQNTTFFHQKASGRRKKNRIESVARPDGTVCNDPMELQQMVVEFYENLYASEGVIGMEESPMAPITSL
ncbi:hypothetical protein D1007_40298 [Hordeum vulgare]|nr:hypothetical protein D1007_40298 [Hordeum vulgare]